MLTEGDYWVHVVPWGAANTNYRLNLSATVLQQSLDVSTVWPLDDYSGHLGADYAASDGTAVLSPVSGRVINVQPHDGYGTMAVAVEVTLPTYRTFYSELEGRVVTTNRVIVIFGHLRPSQNLLANSNAWRRFNSGRNELGYSVGDWISVGQRLGYIETQGYNGISTGPHVHVTMSDAVTPPSNIWQGRGVPENDSRRARYIRPELAWSQLR